MLVKPPPYSRAAPGFCRSASRHPTLSESEFESLTYHHVSQLSNSRDALARRWLLRWGCSAAELFSCCLGNCATGNRVPIRYREYGITVFHCCGE
ncbi:hypothetical protein ACP0HM_06765 [Escherichia coli]